MRMSHNAGIFILRPFMDDFGCLVYPYRLEYSSYMARYGYFVHY